MGTLLVSRKFWVALVALAVIVVGAFVPDYALDEQALVDLVVIAVAYVVGVAVDPGPGNSKIAELLRSRKFWATFVGMSVVVLNGLHLVLPVGLTPDQLTGFAVVIGGYIAGVAIEGKYQKELGQFFTTNIVEQTDPGSGNQ